MKLTLLERYEKIVDKRMAFLKKNDAQLEAIRQEAITKGCPHESTFESYKDTDNGYGSWYRERYSQCKVCGHIETLGVAKI